VKKGIRIELLGIGVILLGIALSTNNFLAYTLGVIGFGVVAAGAFLKDNDK
jgi:uncharacterized membrane protein